MSPLRRAKRAGATPIPAPAPTDGQARIAEAMEAARAKQVQMVEMPVAVQGLAMPPNGHIDFTKVGDETSPLMLLFDTTRRCWIPVSVAAGTWEIRQKKVSRLLGLDGRPIG